MAQDLPFGSFAPASPRAVKDAEGLSPTNALSTLSKLLAPELMAYLTTQAPPPSYAPNAAGKIPPIGYHPNEAGAGLDLMGLIASLPTGGGGKLAMAALPMASRVARAAKALPTDTASRLARAEEIGFRLNWPLGHGTAPLEPINAFDLGRGASTTGATPGRMGVFAEVNPRAGGIADEFAETAAASTGGNPQVMPLVHRTDKPAMIQLEGNEKNHEIAATLDDLWSKGYDAVMMRNYTSPGGKTGDVMVVKDPAQLRSPFAAFDPAKRNSRDLLAGLAGVGAVGSGLRDDR